MRLFGWLRRPLTIVEIETRVLRKAVRLVELSEGGHLKPNEFEARMTRLHEWADRETNKLGRN